MQNLIYYYHEVKYLSENVDRIGAFYDSGGKPG